MYAKSGDFGDTRQKLKCDLIVCITMLKKIFFSVFMAEKGEECLKNHSKDIEKCVEERIPDVKQYKDDPDSVNIAKLTLSEENCK